MTLTLGVERAVGLCYEAIIQPQDWIGALDQLAGALGGKGLNFVGHDRLGQTIDCTHSTEMGLWQELWQHNQDWAIDICSPRGAPRVRQGARALLQSDLFSDDEVQTLPFFQEIAGPAGCRHWASASFVADDVGWCMPVFRSKPFTRADVAQFAEISIHLERIVRMQRARAETQVESELLAFEQLGRAAMLVDRDGLVTQWNEAAASLQSDDFRVRCGRLVSSDRPSQERIDALVHRIRSTPPGALLQAPVAVVRRDDEPWLAIDALPIGQRHGDSFMGHCAILLIRDLSAARVFGEARLQAIFGLTPAEARLAAALFNGKSLGQTAQEFRVGLVTLRSHLKAIFAKTGTARQAELVALLARI